MTSTCFRHSGGGGATFDLNKKNSRESREEELKGHTDKGMGG